MCICVLKQPNVKDRLNKVELLQTLESLDKTPMRKKKKEQQQQKTQGDLTLGGTKSLS